MQAHVKHLIAIIEDVLRPISMMNVPIYYQNFLSLVSCILGRNRDIVEKAEAM